MMEILAIGNFKGGVGKTTITANLGIEFARQGKKVLLIDLDHQSDLTRLLLTEWQDDHPTVLDVLTKKVQITKAIRKVTDRLYLLPGSPDMFLPLGPDRKISPILLKELLTSPRMQKHKFDFVLLDTPPGISEGSTLGYAAATNVLAVVTPEAFSLDNISKYIKVLNTMKNKWNPDLSVLGICLNRVDKRRNLTRLMSQAIEDHYLEYSFRTHISNDTSIPSSHYERKFLRDLRWWSTAAGQFVRLAKEIHIRLQIQGG